MKILLVILVTLAMSTAAVVNAEGNNSLGDWQEVHEIDCGDVKIVYYRLTAAGLFAKVEFSAADDVFAIVTMQREMVDGNFTITKLETFSGVNSSFDENPEGELVNVMMTDAILTSSRQTAEEVNSCLTKAWEK